MKNYSKKLITFALVSTISIPNSIVSLAAENTAKNELESVHTQIENPVSDIHVDTDATINVNSVEYTTSLKGLNGEGTKENPYEINNYDELKWFCDDVNNGNDYKGKYVRLTSDIDLNNEEWTPIGYQGKTFKGNFDGNYKTIKNLTITKSTTNTGDNNGIGFFGRTDDKAVIQNLTIENVDITGSLYVGAVVGRGYTGDKIENVNVKGDIAIDAFWYAGVIGGNGYMSLVNNCHVVGNNGSYIKGNNGSYIGGIWGFRGEGNMSTKNCSVENLNISGVDRVGGITGIGHYGNTISDCTVKNTTIKATDAKATTVGLIAGACQGTESSPTIFENNTVYSSVTATAGDTSVNGMYGTNINGTIPSVQGNESSEILVYSAEIVDGKKYKTLEEAIAAANEGETVKLLSDISVSGVNSLEINKKIILDLNKKTLTTNGKFGGLLLKGGCSLKNGTLVHNGTVAAIKLWNAESIEGVKIQVTGVEGKTIGGIVLQSGVTTRVDLLKDVEIAGATNGIETYNCGNATKAVIGKMESVKISATDTGMLISAPVGSATNCEIYGEQIGIIMHRKGTYSTTLTLECSKVTGKNVAIFVHDENFYDKTKVNTGKVELKIDSSTELKSTNNGCTVETKLGMKENSTIEDKYSKCTVGKDDGSVEHYIKHTSKECSFDEDVHYNICEKCGEIDTDTVVKHEYVLDEETVKEATCTEEGYTGDKNCECGHVVKGEVIAAAGHAYMLDEETVKEATCTEEGYTGDKVCYKIYCKVPIEKGTVVPKIDHKYEEGKCTNCDEIKVGWILIDGKWQYNKADGTKAIGWFKESGKWYYFNNAGEMQIGWLRLENKWYYLNQTGEMAIGWKLVEDKWYYLNQTGEMAIGWKLVEGKWYYLNQTGEMATGWKLVEGKWYYLNNNGEMHTGWINLSGTWYYLKDNGEMSIGWEFIDGAWYYMYNSGAMATNTIIDGWKINSNGVATKIK